MPGFCRVSIKRVNVIAPGTAPNVNPSIDALTVDGERLIVSLSGVEAGEQPFLSWFVTAGELDNFRTDAVGDGLMNKWTPADAAGRLWVVVRDGKGGEGWAAGSR